MIHNTSEISLISVSFWEYEWQNLKNLIFDRNSLLFRDQLESDCFRTWYS